MLSVLKVLIGNASCILLKPSIKWDLKCKIWPVTQYSTCLLTSSPICQYTCESKRNIESLTKYPTINYTAFGHNNMSKFLDYQILADRLILNLKK